MLRVNTFHLKFIFIIVIPACVGVLYAVETVKVRQIMTKTPRISLPYTVLFIMLILSPFVRAELVFTREAFDEKDRQIDANRDIANASPDAFAWGESYMMRGYLEMFLATGDRDYLRRLVRVADQIIATRDDRKAAREGRTDRPFWSLGGKFTVARLMLKDVEGNNAIALRSIPSGNNNKTIVEVIPSKKPGIFSLVTSNEIYKNIRGSNITYKDLSLDPHSPRYFPRVINNPNYVLDPNFKRTDDSDAVQSLLLVAMDVRERKSPTVQLARIGPTNLVPDVVQYYGYTGPIFSAMTRFAKLVYDDKSLHTEFKKDADRLLNSAKESVDAWEDCWRDGPGEGEGYYLSIEKGGGLWWDGIMAPMNYLGAVGQVLLNLYDCLGDEQALQHARAIATLFKNDCRVDNDGAYVFSYWPRVAMKMWRRKNNLSINTPHYPVTSPADDLSHGAWEVEFAVMCYEHGLVFTREDINRFAKTFTKNLWLGKANDGSLHFALRVDGSGVCTPGLDIAGARWLDLCPYEPIIFEMNRQVWETNNLQNAVYEHAIGSYARLYRWQEALQKSKMK